MNVDVVGHRTRSYQQEIFERSMAENTIVVVYSWSFRSSSKVSGLINCSDGHWKWQDTRVRATGLSAFSEIDLKTSAILRIQAELDRCSQEKVSYESRG